MFRLLAVLLIPCLALPALATSPSEATPITIQSDRITIGQALAQVSRQTGVLVEDRSRLPDMAVPLNLQRVPFWQALDNIAVAGNRRVYLYPTTGRITFDRIGLGFRRPPVSYDGRFRCSLLKLYSSRDLETDRVSYAAAVEVAWEPGLLPLYLETRPQNLRVQDDQGHTLGPPATGSSLAPVAGTLALLIDVRLPPVPRANGKLGLLSGDLSVIAPTKMLAFDFGSLAELSKSDEKDARRRLDQEKVSCRIDKVTLNADRWTVRVIIDYPPGGKQLDSYQSWVVYNELILQATDGNRQLKSSDYVLENETARHATISYHFRDRRSSRRGDASDWKLLYRTPASLVEVPVHFTFKDVPLP
jgi:hypothetical protein